MNKNSCHELYNVVKDRRDGIKENGTENYVESTMGDLEGENICVVSVKGTEGHGLIESNRNSSAL